MTCFYCSEYLGITDSLVTVKTMCSVPSNKDIPGSIEEHITHLNRLCRVCSAIINVKDICYYVENYKKRLADTFCIDVSNDKNDVHPIQFCAKCFAATGHNLRRGSTPTFSAVIWLQHTNTCSICSDIQKK